jgi:hypothetical protein
VRCVLHVGDMKCGSTAIQQWICDNEEALRRHGYATSRELRNGGYHSFLSSYAYDDHRIHNFARQECRISDPRQVSAHRRDVRDRLTREIARLPGHVHTMILSHEQLLSLSSREIRRVVSLLREYFNDLKVTVYIRRQDRLFISMWGQRLKSGMPSSRFMARLRRSRHYLRTLQAWESVVGRDAIDVRIFDRREFQAGCIEKDFCHTLGLQWAEEFRPVTMVNESLDAVAQQVLVASHRWYHGQLSLVERIRACLRRQKTSPARLQRLHAMVAFLARNYTGRGLAPPRSWALELLAACARENEVIRRRYLPDRPRLFDNDVSDVAEEGSPEPTAAEALQVAGAVLECFAGVPSAELVTEAYELVLERGPTPEELSQHAMRGQTITEVYRHVLREAGIMKPAVALRRAA